VLGRSLSWSSCRLYAALATKARGRSRMRASVGVVMAGLGLFFDQWVHHTGVMTMRSKSHAPPRGSGRGSRCDRSAARPIRASHAVGVRTGEADDARPRRQRTGRAATVRIATSDQRRGAFDPLHFSWMGSGAIRVEATSISASTALAPISTGRSSSRRTGARCVAV